MVKHYGCSSRSRPSSLPIGVRVPPSAIPSGAGIVNNRPFDFSLTERARRSVRLGVICPAADASVLARGVERLNRNLQPGAPSVIISPTSRGSRPRVRTANRFASSSGAGGRLSDPKTDGRREPARSTSPGQLPGRSRGFGRATVRASFSSSFRHGSRVDENSRPRARRSISTTFVKPIVSSAGCLAILRQDTLEDPHQCVSGGGYRSRSTVKSMRTPWVLDSSMPTRRSSALDSASTEERTGPTRLSWAAATSTTPA